MPITNEETRLFLPCGCAGNCTILAVDRFNWGDEDDPASWYFDLYTSVGPKASWWYRFKMALSVLFGRNHYLDALCFDDNEIQALRDFIDINIKKEDHEL